MDWLAAGLTILSCELLVHKKWYGWILGLVNQGVWYYISITNRLWGVAVLATIMSIMSARGLLRWYREEYNE